MFFDDPVGHPFAMLVMLVLILIHLFRNRERNNPGESVEPIEPPEQRSTAQDTLAAARDIRFRKQIKADPRKP